MVYRIDKIRDGGFVVGEGPDGVAVFCCTSLPEVLQYIREKYEGAINTWPVSHPAYNDPPWGNVTG